MRIAIDIDGVLSDFSTNFLKVAERINKKKYDIDRWTKWGIVESGVMTQKECSKTWKEYLKAGEYANQKPINPTSVRTFLRKLFKDNHRVHFVTCRDVKHGSSTFDWLKKYNFFMGRKWGLICLPLKSDKYLMLNDYEYDVAIDDKFETLKYANAVKLRILFGTRSNRGDKCDGVKRIESWAEIYKAIKGLEEEK